MSGTIKPEDIGAEFIDAVEDNCGYIATNWGYIPENNLIAAILNTAIEAGLVSPPCWETKFTHFESESVFKRKGDAIRHAEYFHNSEVRHWKGQTE